MYINLCFKRVISSLDVQFDEGRVADAKHQDYTNFELKNPWYFQINFDMSNQKS